MNDTNLSEYPKKGICAGWKLARSIAIVANSIGKTNAKSVAKLFAVCTKLQPHMTHITIPFVKNVLKDNE